MGSKSAANERAWQPGNPGKDCSSQKNMTSCNTSLNSMPLASKLLEQAPPCLHTLQKGGRGGGGGGGSAQRENRGGLCCRRRSSSKYQSSIPEELKISVQRALAVVSASATEEIGEGRVGGMGGSLATGDGHGQVLGTRCVGSDEGQVDVGLGRR